MKSNEKIITPINFARKIGKRPQQVYQWIRENKIPSHQCICGHTYLIEDEVVAVLKKKAEQKKSA